MRHTDHVNEFVSREVVEMASVLMRVPEEARDLAKQLARKVGGSAGDVVLQALKHFQDAQFWAEANAAYAARTPDQEAEDQAEIAAWDKTLRDDLDADEAF